MADSRTALAIDPKTNDLHFDSDGNLVLVHNAEAVGQHVRQRLKHFQGEWFLDIEAGTPWIDDVLGKNYDSALSEAIIKDQISGTDGVESIESFSIQFDRTKRELLSHRITVSTMYDEVTSI